MERAVESTSTIEPLFEAIQAGDLGKVNALIAAHPSMLNARNARGASPLSWAAYTGQAAILAALRSRRPELDFFEACIVSDESAVRAAMEAGQDVDAFAPDGFTPLALAVFFGHAVLARRLIEAGADVNLRAKNDQHVGPIHAALARGDLQTLELLLQMGADPNAPQEKNIRPLHEAASSGSTVGVALLLMYGADPAAKADDGHTAADLARGKGYAIAARLEALAAKR
jgi:ankyrin repeat protein